MKTRITEEMVNTYTWAGLWGRFTLLDYLDRNARDFPERVALVDARSRLTFTQVRSLVDRLAYHLLDVGIRRGDRVGIQLPGWNEFFLARYAVSQIGAIPVLLIVSLRHRELRHALGTTGACAVIVPATFNNFDHLEMIRQLKPDLPDLQHVIAGDEAGQDAYSLPALLADPVEERLRHVDLRSMSRGPNEVDDIRLTAGTGALPKIVMHTANRHVLVGQVIAERTRMTYQDTIAAIAPVSGGIGMIGSIPASAVTGARVVLQEKFDARDALALIARERATVAVAVPTQIVKMLNCPEIHDYELSSLRCLISGGGRLPDEVERAARAAFGCPIANNYGSVDTGVAAMSAIDDPPEEAIGTVGRAVRGVELRVLDEDGRSLEVGQVGEVALRGATISAGFYDDPELTKERYTPDGFVLTGDLGVIDDRSYLRIVGRKKDVIIRGGQNISPREVEEMLFTHPKVSEAVVVGMPDPILGERACAFVIPRPGQEITLPEIIDYLRGHGIAMYKLPERLEVRQEFPISSGGKVMRQALRDEIAGILEAEARGMTPT